MTLVQKVMESLVEKDEDVIKAQQMAVEIYKLPSRKHQMMIETIKSTLVSMHENEIINLKG
jgi:hypothetical protein